MKTVTVLTPFSPRKAIELGNHRWKKQLLPVGEIEYKGRKLQFTADYLKELARSFKEKAFDAIPFQLAPDDNKHTNNPERTRGRIEDVEVADDGLYVIVEATEAGDKIIRENPSLGVSARIYENYERSDGKRWTAALQHVLGTLDPHIAGMKPWTEVAALSNASKSRVLDLTSATLPESEEDSPVPMTKEKLKDLLKQMRDSGSEISDEDLDELITDDLFTDEDGEGDTEGSDEELTDEELEELLNSLPDVEEDEEETVNAGGAHPDALELANARFQEQAIELAQMRSRMDGAAFDNEKTAFVAAGISPKLVELARPLLEGEGHIVQLSNGDEVDAGGVMRRVLRELSQTVKLLDLSDLMGRGDIPDEEREEQEREASERAEFVKRERARSGL
jgi:hypothetical protein